jgi:hypothetical protein
MFKQTALITWQPEGSADTRAAILAAAEKSVTGASLSRFAPTVAGSHQGGDVVWHLHFSGKAVWEASGLAAALDWLSAEPEVSVLDACAYETSRYGVLAPDIQGGIYRTLFVGVDETASAEAALQFADELAGMPEYISEILNWGMNPVLQSRGRVLRYFRTARPLYDQSLSLGLRRSVVRSGDALPDRAKRRFMPQCQRAGNERNRALRQLNSRFFCGCGDCARLCIVIASTEQTCAPA